jgi:hypothetical protein
MRRVDLNFFGSQESASALAFDFGLARLFGLLAFSFVLVMLAAGPMLGCARQRVFGQRVVMRMVPAASKNRMDEQQAGHQASEKCVHSFAAALHSILPLIGYSVTQACGKDGATRTNTQSSER